MSGTALDPRALSAQYAVRCLTAADVELIYALCRENRLFYAYHPPFVTRERILTDMTALPPGADARSKLFLGFFEGERLTAILDLILDWPEEHIAWIGLFMTDVRVQNCGVGSAIIRDLSECLSDAGTHSLRLGVDRGNPQSAAFWRKNGFSVLREGEYIIMERMLCTFLKT